MYSIVEIKGKQYKVEPGKSIKVDYLGEGHEGKEFTDYHVLLFNDGDGNIEVGTPYLENRGIEAKVVGHVRGKKIKVVKYKPKINYTRTKGHRQKYSEVAVNSIR